MAQVKVDITADGAGFHRTMKGINSSVAGLAGSLKGQLAAAFSIATIGYISKQILDFGDNIQTMANNLDISTDSAQQFAWAMRNANIEGEALYKTMDLLDQEMRKAKGGDVKSNQLMAKLGFGPQDYDMKKEDLLKQMLENINGHNWTGAQAKNVLVDMGLKPSTAGKVIGAREDILNENIPLVPEDQIAKLDAIGDAMSNIGVILLTSVVPVLLKMASAAAEWTAYILEGLNNMHRENVINADAVKAAERAYDTNRPDNTPPADLDWTKLNPFTPNKRMYPEAYVKNMYGEVGLKAFNDYKQSKSNYAKVVDGFTVAMDKIKEQVDKLNATLEGRAGRRRELPFVRDAITAENNIKPNGNKVNQNSLGTNEFLRIGGALGIDANYRIERLTLIANTYLLRTTVATEETARLLAEGRSQQLPPR